MWPSFDMLCPTYTCHHRNNQLSASWQYYLEHVLIWSQYNCYSLGRLFWHFSLAGLANTVVIEYSSPYQATQAGHRGKLTPACAVIASGTAGERLKLQLLAASRPPSTQGGGCNKLYTQV